MIQKHALPALVEAYTKEVAFKEKTVRDKIEELLRQPLLPAEQQKVYDTLGKYVTLNFVFGLSQRYPVISEGIFGVLKREELIYPHDHRPYTFEAPAVVRIPLQEGKIGGYFQIEKVRGIRKMDDREVEAKLSCPIPEIIPEARRAVAESIGFSAELVSKAYQDDLISKIIMTDVIQGKAFETPLNATKYSLVWAPSKWGITELKIIEKDPAIFMKYADTNFMVYRWNIPEENNLEAMLREFTDSLGQPN